MPVTSVQCPPKLSIIFSIFLSKLLSSFLSCLSFFIHVHNNHTPYRRTVHGFDQREGKGAKALNVLVDLFDCFGGVVLNQNIFYQKKIRPGNMTTFLSLLTVKNIYSLLLLLLLPLLLLLSIIICIIIIILLIFPLRCC